MDSPQMISGGRVVAGPALVSRRLIWGGIVMGQLAFAVVIIVLQHQGSLHATDLPLNIMIPLDAVMLAFGILITLLIPWIVLKPEADDKTFQRQCALANLIPMAILDGASFFGLVIVMLTTQWWPAGIVPAIAILIQLLIFPRSVVKSGRR